jgi:hypothetical protein
MEVLEHLQMVLAEPLELIQAVVEVAQILIFMLVELVVLV